MTLSRKFLTHYYVRDNLHSLDALVWNKCASHELALFHELARAFDIDVKIDVTVPTEGGYKEAWEFIGKNATQLMFLLALATAILSRFPTTNSKLEKLTEQLTEVSIQEKLLQIEKLKSELAKGVETASAVDSAYELANTDTKIRIRRSLFYKTLINDGRVTGVGFASLDQSSGQNEPKEQKVVREEFTKGILNLDKIPEIIDEKAKIEIISPVLKHGNYTWRGIYNGEIISFSMADPAFKSSVLRKEIHFASGSYIVGKLVSSRKVDENGNIEISGRSVKIVIENGDSVSSQETPQGKKYRDSRRASADQLNFEME